MWQLTDWPGTVFRGILIQTFDDSIAVKEPDLTATQILLSIYFFINIKKAWEMI